MLTQEDQLGEFVTQLINQPWEADGLHCWKLTCLVQSEVFGRELPPIIDVASEGLSGRKINEDLFRNSEERKFWKESCPVHGAVVLMRRKAASEGRFTHSGVYLNLQGGGIIHVDKPHGVVFDTGFELALRGWVPTYFVPR